MDTSSLFNLSFTDFEFGSETTGLEYNILGNMSFDEKSNSITSAIDSSTSSIPTTIETTSVTSSNNQIFNAFSSIFPFTSSSTNTVIQPQSNQTHFQQPKHQFQRQSRYLGNRLLHTSLLFRQMPSEIV
ncbi:hypothetical protein BD560DRAFT_234605 [Blakeslea trispora]|nr:hypothetical protein BD560DRAFT_234605 [Blakeslea trispora]